MLDQQQWDSWLQHPGTQALRTVLYLWKHERKEQWASGQFTDVSQFGTAILNAKAIGGCEVIDKVLGLEFSLVTEAIEDVEQLRFNPAGQSSPGGALG